MLEAARDGRARLDRLGVVIALHVAGATLLLPFASYSPNRILPGEPQGLLAALPAGSALLLTLVLAAVCLAALVRGPDMLRLGAGVLALAVLMVMAGRAGTALTPADNPYGRVSPGSGFWVLVFACALLCADAFVQLGLGPWQRLAALGLALGALALILWLGTWNELSLLKEYATRADAFWREGRRHVALAFGSLAIATAAGIPLGIACFRDTRLRGPVLNALNVIQTIPSIALFGLLIAPLAWVAANVPGARAAGISGSASPRPWSRSSPIRCCRWCLTPLRGLQACRKSRATRRWVWV